MARLYSAGFELNSTTANVEFTSATGTIVTTNPHTGTYSGAVTSLTANAFKGFAYQFSAANANGPYYVQFWIYITTAPNANTTIAGLQQSGGNENLTVVLSTTRTLSLFTTDGATQIGSASSAVPLTTWTCIELKMDNTPATGSKVGEMRVNQVVTATSSTLTSTNYTAGVDEFFIGGNLEGEGATTINIQFDDITINDSTTSFNNTYSGGSSLLRYSPSAAGDSNTFGTQVGGTAGSANNFTRVKEVTPDNATSYNASITAASDLFAVAAVGGTLPAGTINNVLVGGVVANLTGADTTASLQFQIEQTTGGTIQKSGAIIPDTLTWSTNSKAIPHNYPLSAPQDPTNTNWTATTIGTMQIGYLIDTVHTDADAVSTIWAYVDYTPSSAVNASVAQVGATLTFTGGTQVVQTASTDAQVGATLTFTGGTQSVASVGIVAVAQAGATLTFTGGTQTVITLQTGSVSQSAATLTFTGGTQSTKVTSSQSAATLTFTGGTQAVTSIQDVAISQSAATLTFTGGTQAIVAVRDVAISQVGATLTFTGGTQVVASIQDVSISQTHATLTFTGGTQSVAAVRDALLAQVAASLTFTGGTQVLASTTSSSISQLGATILFTGGTQIVIALVPPQFIPITVIIGTTTETATANSISSANILSSVTIDTVTSQATSVTEAAENPDAIISGSNTDINIKG